MQILRHVKRFICRFMTFTNFHYKKMSFVFCHMHAVSDVNKTPDQDINPQNQGQYQDTRSQEQDQDIEDNNPQDQDTGSQDQDTNPQDPRPRYRIANIHATFYW